MDKIGIYVLRIMAPNAPSDPSEVAEWDNNNQEIINNIGSALSAAEEAVSNALPDGYLCIIEEA